MMPARMGWFATLAVAAATVACLLAAATAWGGAEDYALKGTSASVSTEQAGGHPDFTTSFKLDGDPANLGPWGAPEPWARTRDIVTELPPGLLGNPSAFPTCSTQLFMEQLGYLNDTSTETCETDSQIGMVSPALNGIFAAAPGEYSTPLFNLEAPGGNTGIVARLGFVGAIYPAFVDFRIDPKRDNAVTATVVNANALMPLVSAKTTVWGVPTDSSHDDERMNWEEALDCHGPCKGPTASGLKPTPFTDTPTSCAPADVGTTVISYQRPEGGDSDVASLPELTGCESVPFEPAMSLEPTTRSAGAPSGLDASLHIPQEGLTHPEALATAHLKEASVSLPVGFSLNASAADGLGSCTPEQIGLDRNERQLIDLNAYGAPVSLSFDGQSTAQLPQLASAAQVQAALEALPGIGPGAVAVSGRPGGPWTVDFGGSLAGQDAAAIGGTRSELQRLALRARGGTYKLVFKGQATIALPYNASASEVQAALEALPGISGGDLEVVPSDDGLTRVFRIGFTGGLTETNVPEITVKNNLTEYDVPPKSQTLVDGRSAVSTETVQEGGTIRFDGAKPTCPESSKVATGEIRTPVLSEPLEASFYLAKQEDNPFGSLFAGYLVARGAGALVKAPAKIDVDPQTGQVTTTFPNSPQQPFEDLELHFKGGNRGLITTPEKCGTYASTYELTPWSGNPPVKGESEFTLDENCAGGAFAPGFHAGSETALAGSFTSFATRVSKDAGSPALTKISVDLPEGLSAKLAGIPPCPDSALDAMPTAPGTGQVELAAPSCSAASQIGTVVAGAGSGAPFYVKTGKVYLAGPDQGAPLSLAVITPAVAGPFDLGNVLVRVPVSLNPATARAHASSDPIPTMLSGIPLAVRDVRVLLNRQGFVLNPTGCEPKSADGVIEGEGGVSAQVSDRFQVGECAALGFKPSLSLRLSSGTRVADPALTAVLRPRPGDANIASISVTFPHAEFIDQGHLGDVCTRVQFAAEQCPARSVYGTISATTPLLDQPLTGNVYLRSNPEHELPDLVTDLHGPAGQPIHLEAAGRIDSVNGGLRSRFEFIPDAPITQVTLKMEGGRHGLLQNSRNICVKTPRVTIAFAAHSGRMLESRPKLKVRCGRGSRSKGKHGARGSSRRGDRPE